MKLLPFLALLGSFAMLTGCTTTPIEAPPTVPPNSSRPVALDLDCSEMVPVDDLVAIWGSGIASIPYHQAGAAGSWEMQGTALMQDGVLACAWAEDDAGPQLLVLAMDDAAEGFDLSEESFLGGQVFPYAETPLGDRSSAFCRNDSADAGVQCHWNLLSGTTWLSFYFQGVPEDEISEDGHIGAIGRVGAIVSAVIDSVEAAPRVSIERSESQIPTCDLSVTPGAVSEALGVDPLDVVVDSGRPLDESLGKSNPTFGQVMWAYSFARLGYSECNFATSDVNGTVMVAPGAAWVIEEPAAQQPEVVEVADLGRGLDYCVEEQSFVLCTVAVAVGPDLVLAQVAPQSAEQGSALALALVRTAIASAD